VMSSGPVTEFEQPARPSAKRAPRGRSARMAGSPRWKLPTNASARPSLIRRRHKPGAQFLKWFEPLCGVQTLSLSADEALSG
jgi:hypothetical protein